MDEDCAMSRGTDQKGAQVTARVILDKCSMVHGYLDSLMVVQNYTWCKICTVILDQKAKN